MYFSYGHVKTGRDRPGLLVYQNGHNNTNKYKELIWISTLGGPGRKAYNTVSKILISNLSWYGWDSDKYMLY